MNAQILPMPGVLALAQPIAHYVHIGLTAHRQLETLHAEGRFRARRVVIDAARFAFQKDLVAALRASGTEFILDTDAAELSALGRFDGQVSAAPWARPVDGRPLRPSDFAASDRRGLIAEIARFAVAKDMQAVLAPCHLLRQGSRDVWFDVDRSSCIALREALDREGGKNIAINYLLIPTYTHLHDETERGALLHGLESLPFDNLWIRASGFGSDATPLGATRYITALSGLHNLGKPIVADNLGGLIGLAAVAFGGASGFAHGVGERERFNAGDWDKPRKKNEDGRRGGHPVRIAIPGLDRSLTVDELDLLAKARGGHRLVICGDRNCCPHGRDDMVKNWRAHFLYQRSERLSKLEKVPDQNRARHFLDVDVAEADRLARQVKELKIGDDDLSARLVKHSRKIEAMRAALENFYEVRGRSSARAPAVIPINKEEHGTQGGSN
jgi:hypothetical protein